MQVFEFEEFARIGHGFAVDLHMALLNQSGTHAAGAKALAVQNVFKAHGFERFGFHGA